MDLLTVVLHELGRTLGYTTSDARRIPVMQVALAPGERLSLPPLPRAAASLQAAVAATLAPRPSLRLTVLGGNRLSWIRPAARGWIHAAKAQGIRARATHSTLRRMP